MLLLSGTGTEAPATIDVLKIGEHRVAKVPTKNDTVNLGLPCVAEGEDITCCSGRALPEAKKVGVCCDRLSDGTGTPPEAACSSTLTEFPCKLLELGLGCGLSSVLSSSSGTLLALYP